MTDQDATMSESSFSPADQAMSDIQETGSKHPDRSMDICAECRRRKKACRPINRKWPYDGKCDECKKAGLECGPNTRHRVGMDSISSPPSASESPESLIQVGQKTGNTSARRITNAQWDGIKDSFKRLYMDEGQKLSDVMEIMQRDYHFTASTRQFHRQIEKWGLRKYNKTASSRTGTFSDTSSPSIEHAELVRLPISSSVEPRNVIQLRQSERPETFSDQARRLVSSVPIIGRTPLQHTVSQDQNMQEPWNIVQLDAGSMSNGPHLAGPRQIRLILLTPGSRNDPVHIELHVTALEDYADKYEAVSWAWETDKDADTIFVHEKPFQVKEGLASALRLFRDVHKPQWLWFDGACINYEDPTEKSEQVQLMADIYAGARAAHVWLGAGTADTYNAMRFVQTILDMNAVEELLKFPHALPLWEGFNDMLNLPWFRGSLILQKVSFAKRCILHWGESRLPWQDFVDAVNMVKSLEGSLQVLNLDWSGDFFNQLQVSDAMQVVSTSRLTTATPPDGRLTNRGPSLETLLNMYRVSHATDPRDRIYSVLLLSGAWKPGNAQIQPENAISVETPIFGTPSETDTGSDRLDFTLYFIDYRKSIWKICIEVVELVLRDSDSVDIICRPWAPEWDGLPSWISTLGRDSFKMARNGLYTRVNADPLVGAPDRVGKPYNACRKLQVGTRRFGHILDNGVFAIQGFALGRISKVSSVAIEGCVPPDWLALGQWNNVENPPPDAFCRILVADRDDTGQRPPPTWFPVVCKWAFNQPVPGEPLNTKEMLQKPKCPPYVAVFLRRVQSVVWKRRLFVTHENHIGIGPEHMQAGDSVNILLGCSVPVVLREIMGELRNYHLIGDCYVDGMMDGEACRDTPVMSNYYLR
jgi:hypothetical protein